MADYEIRLISSNFSESDKQLIRENYAAYKETYKDLVCSIQNTIQDNCIFYPYRDSFGREMHGFFMKTQYGKITMRAVFSIDHENKRVDIIGISIYP